MINKKFIRIWFILIVIMGVSVQVNATAPVYNCPKFIYTIAAPTNGWSSPAPYYVYNARETWTINTDGSYAAMVGVLQPLLDPLKQAKYVQIKGLQGEYVQGYLAGANVLTLGPGGKVVNTLPPDGNLSNNDKQIICTPTCTVSGEEYNPSTGQCETACVYPNAIDLQGDCVECPSGTFLLGGGCLPLCGHGTFEPVGATINSPTGGFCVVPGCTGGEKLTEGKCYPDCSRLGLVYKKEDGACHVECPDDMIPDSTDTKCISRCPAGEKWVAAGPWTEAGCVPSTTPLPECPTINGITGTRDFEGKCKYKPLEPLDCADGYIPDGLDCVEKPLDCGQGKHQEGSRCVDNPPTPEKPTTPPPPEENPPVTPENAPVIPPETPPEEKSAKLLENIDKNIKKQIESSNANKSTLKNIADNQAKQVDNSAKGVEEAGKQTQELRQQTKIAQDQASTLAGIKTEITNQTDQPVKAAIEGIGDKITDKLDEQKTDGTGPAAATFEGGFNTEQDFSEHENASEIATEKATAAKESLPAAGTTPFIVGTTITQDACIVGNFRGTEWRACFDYPWAVVAYQIMKTVLIVVGYIQSIMLINRGMNGG